MSALVLPDTCIKVSRSSAPKLEGIWPIGQLYYHLPTETYFRFIDRGNRWERLYGISTPLGVFCLTGLRHRSAYEHVFEFKTKREVLDRFILWLDSRSS